MEKHVTSLELSKKLKELGVSQESNFWWVEYTDGFGKEEIWSVEKEHIGYKQFVSAYLASELGEMIIKNSDVAKGIQNSKLPKEIQLDENPLKQMFDANHWAKFIIYLLENSLLKPEDLTK